MEGRVTARMVHVVLPVTHRSLCGYEEEGSAPADGAATLACPECSALLRSGLLRPPSALRTSRAASARTARWDEARGRRS